MATIREIRTRIRAVRNIEKITRAMKLVAAARLKRATNRVAAARPYAEHVNAMRQVPTVLQLLPLKPPAEEDGEVQGSAAGMIFEPPAAQLLASLLPRYVDIQLYRSMAEAIASEHGARMTSMSAATENAGT